MRGRGVTAVVIAGALAGCAPDREPLLLLPLPLPQRPIDVVADGEIAAGTERAFGLELPREMRVRAKLDDAWFARGAVRMDQVTNYVRRRVVAERVDTGPNKTVFVDAVVVGDVSGRRVQVEVSKVQDKVEMVVRDRTRPPAEPGMSEADRWRQAGIAPGGKVLKEQNR